MSALSLVLLGVSGLIAGLWGIVLISRKIVKRDDRSLGKTIAIIVAGFIFVGLGLLLLARVVQPVISVSPAQ